jgi:hypothetical protein
MGKVGLHDRGAGNKHEVGNNYLSQVARIIRGDDLRAEINSAGLRPTRSELKIDSMQSCEIRDG